ncbi:MAG: hypothetical protein H9917_09345 [Candidatus Oceanisphaera merdipullorum]|nr:hypothetical protein [Candidatus Oceanisphaera merdipullorum]
MQTGRQSASAQPTIRGKADKCSCRIDIPAILGGQMARIEPEWAACCVYLCWVMDQISGEYSQPLSNKDGLNLRRVGGSVRFA